MPSSSVRPCLQLLSSRPSFFPSLSSAILHNAVAQGHDRNATPGEGAARSPPPPPSSQPAEAGAERCAAEPARRVPPTSGPCFPLPAAGPAGRPCAPARLAREPPARLVAALASRKPPAGGSRSASPAPLHSPREAKLKTQTEQPQPLSGTTFEFPPLTPPPPPIGWGSSRGSVVRDWLLVRRRLLRGDWAHPPANMPGICPPLLDRAVRIHSPPAWAVWPGVGVFFLGASSYFQHPPRSPGFVFNPGPLLPFVRILVPAPPPPTRPG